MITIFFPIFLHSANSATAVNNASVEELRPVSTESWITPITNPTPTTCIATSFGIPNKLQANGIRSNDPPATPDAPQALTADKILKIRAVPKSTWIPNVCTAARVNTDIVIAL